MVVREAAVADIKRDIGRTAADDGKTVFTYGRVDAAVCDADHGRTRIILNQDVARIGAVNGHVVEANRAHQVDEMYPVFLVLVADIAEIAVADDAVLHAAVNRQICKADITGIEYVHRRITACVCAVCLSLASRAAGRHILGERCIDQVHIAERDILGADQLDTPVIDVLDGAAAAVGTPGSGHCEVPRACVVKDDAFVGRLG